MVQLFLTTYSSNQTSTAASRRTCIHISIELIELARATTSTYYVYLHTPLISCSCWMSGCLSHLRVTSPKAAANTFLSIRPGRVVTNDKLALLVAEAWPSSFTAVNIMSGFKKSGVYPLNPGEVTDWQLAPSNALCPRSQPEDTKAAPTPGSPLFSPEQEAMYQ